MRHLILTLLLMLSLFLSNGYAQGYTTNTLAFSPDGKRLVSGSMDNSIRLWDVETGVEQAILSGHVADVNALAFATDG